MTALSQSHFLQALGWATLNSFWQMALLWCGFLVANQLFNLTANRKYLFSIFAVLTGFAAFVVSFILYSEKTPSTSLGFIKLTSSSMEVLPILLTASSIAYLILLVFPTYKLFKNWQFITLIRRKGLQKIDIQYKLFVKRIAERLSIRQKVAIYLSDLVTSPLTIGYFKPIILLPLASINNLTVQQTEAILLHELSHIKRYDYLINFILCIAHTLLYFNPFVRLFVRIAEEERENCCDAMVLQFGYDKLGYATALLNLEKLALQNKTLAIGATGKENLLNRIERIVGLQKRRGFSFTHLAGLVAALLCIFAVNLMVLTVKEERPNFISFKQFANPFYFLQEEIEPLANKKAGIEPGQKQATTNQKTLSPVLTSNQVQTEVHEIPLPPEPSFVQVSFNEAQASLSEKEKENVKKTVENTKQVLRSVQWKEVEKAIGEVMSEEEKKLAKKEYLMEIDKINWQNLEKNLKLKYDKINWERINLELAVSLSQNRLDSTKQSYQSVLAQIDQLSDSMNRQVTQLNQLPFPDESIKNLNIKKNEIRCYLNKLDSLATKQVIKL